MLGCKALKTPECGSPCTAGGGGSVVTDALGILLTAERAALRTLDLMDWLSALAANHVARTMPARAEQVICVFNTRKTESICSSGDFLAVSAYSFTRCQS